MNKSRAPKQNIITVLSCRCKCMEVKPFLELSERNELLAYVKDIDHRHLVFLMNGRPIEPSILGLHV